MPAKKRGDGEGKEYALKRQTHNIVDLKYKALVSHEGRGVGTLYRFQAKGISHCIHVFTTGGNKWWLL